MVAVSLKVGCALMSSLDIMAVMVSGKVIALRDVI